MTDEYNVRYGSLQIAQKYQVTCGSLPVERRIISAPFEQPLRMYKQSP